MYKVLVKTIDRGTSRKYSFMRDEHGNDKVFNSLTDAHEAIKFAIEADLYQGIPNNRKIITYCVAPCNTQL